MLLIYSQKTSTRLQYVCKFIFDELLGTAFSITLHESSFAAHDGPKLNYSTKDFANAYQICPAKLLFESTIQEQSLRIEGKGESCVVFKVDEGNHPFDIFAAIFFLISRYEEYLPHKEDMYGRYAYEQSVAYEHSFLDNPLVNNWVQQFGEKLKSLWPEIDFNPPNFSFQPTYDIDIARSYKGKGFLRNAFGFFKNPSPARITTLLGMRDDPFDSYRFLEETHTRYKLEPIYFFLVAEKNGLYDKNILPSNPGMQLLIKETAVKYKTGLHPSWRSNEHPALLLEEKAVLAEAAGRSITASRQHYIKMKLPVTYERLIAAEITDDYSMGYGSINGFRASVASSFFWYNLREEKITALRIHPFCFMDANCFYEQKLSVEESFRALMHYYESCKKAGGTLITIFHNNFLGTDKFFRGWRELWQKFIAQTQQQIPRDA